MYALLAILVLVSYFVLVRVAMGHNDRKRISHEILAQGGKVVSITWRLFGLGWIGDSSDRIYQVVWIDRFGYRREASCKTSTLSGVYFNEANPPPPQERSVLVAEAERDVLRRQIKKLRSENEAMQRAQNGPRE
jgi:hypothetical protein